MYHLLVSVPLSVPAGDEWSPQCRSGNCFCCNPGDEPISFQYVQSFPHDWNTCKSLLKQELNCKNHPLSKSDKTKKEILI